MCASAQPQALPVNDDTAMVVAELAAMRQHIDKLFSHVTGIRSAFAAIAEMTFESTTVDPMAQAGIKIADDLSEQMTALFNWTTNISSAVSGRPV